MELPDLIAMGYIRYELSPHTAAKFCTAVMAVYVLWFYGSRVCLFQVQRGFRSVVVYLTALDSSCDFLAVGSSIGMLYLYCRRLAHMNKYSLEVRALLPVVVCFSFTLTLNVN